MFTELIENKATQRHRSEAETEGLVLLGPSKKGKRYRNYQFTKCGHNQEIQIMMVRKGAIRCQNCITEKHHTEAESVGIVLVGPSTRDLIGYRRYRFTLCGHEQEIATTAVRKGQVRCQQCLDERLINEALKTGLILLGAGKNCNYRNYQFLECGHEQEIYTANVRKGEQCFYCQQCKNEKLQNEAVASGMVLVGSSELGNANYRKYRLGCGHLADLQTGHVRKGNAPTCLECGDNHFTKQSYLYLTEFETNCGKKAVKLGIANNMNVREMTWLLREGVKTKIMALWLCQTKLELNKIEKQLHKGIQGLSAEQGKEFVGSGYTEFYGTDKLNELIQAASDPKHGLLRLQ